MLLCLPRIYPSNISCPTPRQQPHQCGQWKPEGWEKLRHRWAVHNIVYVPDSSFSQPMPYSPWRHSVPVKITNTVVNETTLLVHSMIDVEKCVSEIRFHCWKEISDGIWGQTKLEAQRNRRRTGGELEANWRRPKMSTSKALSGWIEGWAVLRGFLRCVAFQICAILAHP